ncbi:virulence factor Mce [Aeromicrobium sp. A1-2]|uniref:MCE family protein n=1 Tax=Aeromicrobium sp. A1-2 TaxID=2107713 RepID=UPI000E4F4F48|nr:MCE family protein [Aeromicrobium sp. A1-2]AXT83929.1 virulence factor Mce [Aeromicrobium sp. A1-2]
MTRAESRREAVGLQLTGLVYVLVIGALIWLSIAIYAKTFTDHVTIELRAERAGQQLNVGGDVRMNGAIVGRVAKVEPGRPGAHIALQIDHEAADQIPSDVTGRILPTTLFGQKFVELSSAADPTDDHLEDGTIIQQDTSAEAVEITQVLDNLDPLLTAVRPERLAATLGALSTGLEGRGATLGRLIDDSGSYLTSLNQLTPDLERDLGLLRDVSGQYADAAPDLLALARSASVTTSTIVARQGDLRDFYVNVSGAAAAGDDLLRANRENLVEAARLARPTLELLEEYAPEVGCVLDGFLAVAAQTTAQISGVLFKGQFTLGAQVPGYSTSDTLEFGDIGTGPACRGLPNAPIPYPGVTLNDGYSHPPANDLLPILLGPDARAPVLP